MTVYPFEIDSDSDIVRIDENITELGGEAINQIRDAIFAIEIALGILPYGSVSSVANRLDVSLNPDGTLKTSALTSVGLVTLPIDDADVGTNAGIKEFKLDLDHSTSDLHTLILANTALLNSLNSFAQNTNSNLNTHIGGGAILVDGSPGRHVASHIDLNTVPTDTRDSLFTWSGLIDKLGNLRSATTVAEALDQINTDFVNHQNATEDAHEASAVNIDTAGFEVIPQDIDTVQKFADFIDEFEVITLKNHRADQHANAIPLISRSQHVSLPDGYGWQSVVAPTLCNTYLVRAPNTMPVDDISSGDDVVSFNPDNTGFTFDAQFVRAKVGDIIRINYANGTEASFPIESIRFIPGSEWIIRINGVNLVDSTAALARIDRPMYDRNTAGVLAVAAANATPTGSFDTILQSVIVGNPRGATAVGLGFDAGQLDLSHYKLYLEFYPTGNPTDRVISLPFIDVTGNGGATPGKYTLERVVAATNNKLREIGYNYRLIAFEYNGQFCLMIADAINNASFAIISGSNSSGTLAVGSFTENVIGDAVGDGFDALGLGQTHADEASPAYISTFVDSTAALLPTKIIAPAKSRNYIVDGVRIDEFASTWLANSDGYWDGYISARTPVGIFTVETTYAVELNLKPAELKPGRTIVVQPTVAFTDPLYNDVDYGRFIIKSVSFAGCPGQESLTLITVINGVHGVGFGFSASGEPNLPVRLYFGEDSVSFNNQNIIDTSPSAVDYHRLHEIFISNEKKTFSHERARMRVQAEASPDLGTTNWHIQDVSPKLRGYTDDVDVFNRFVRFYILSYDSDTGEYDGYIGQRSPTTFSILKVGPVTRGRKDVPTRFYDETNIDYIDLIFLETSATSPGNGVLSDGISGGGGTPRYVDIELFQSLQLDDEMFLLATAEVNWDPAFGQDVVQRVVDKREFGSVDEEDFTNSAKDFISAGDRLLHENGIIRGLDFDFVNPTLQQEVFYKGGVAIVNGNIISVNAISVTIPEILENGDSTPVLVDWAVCVNEGGNLEPILITPTKQQFFAKDNNGSSTYYVPSVTFAELIETRKDLTPISVISATIASITIFDDLVLDVRRFVYDGHDRELVFSPSDYAGTFHTVSGLVNWANKYNSDAPLKVKMRGTFNINDEDSILDFSNLSTAIELEGDGAVVNITTSRGILIGTFGGLSLNNITFNYNPEGLTYVDNDKINGGKACIYGTIFTNVSIKNCVFNSTTDGQRPAFIGCTFQDTMELSNITISDNRFNDSGTGDAAYQSAIAMVKGHDISSLDPAILYNIRIENNVCNRFQGIYILQEALSQASSSLSISRGMAAYDVIIARNNCGAIGWLTSALDGGEALVYDRIPGILVENNTCVAIGHMFNHGYSGAAIPGTRFITLLNLENDHSIGRAEVIGNKCNIIIMIGNEITANSEFCRLTIDRNQVTATDSDLIDNWASTGQLTASDVQSYAIAVFQGQDDPGEVTISNNILTHGLFNSISYRFTIGINVSVSANVIGNMIWGMADAGTGIKAVGSGTSPRRYNITNNQIYRDGYITIGRFIDLDTSATRAEGICVDNFFSSPYIDSSDTDDETINGTGTSPSATIYAYTFLVERNKNQTETIYITSGEGNHAVGISSGAFIAGGSATFNTSSGVTTTNPGTVSWIYAVGAVGTQIIYDWLISLRQSLPVGVRLLSVAVSFDGSANVATSSQDDLVIGLTNQRTGSSLGTVTNTAIGSTPGTTTLLDPTHFTNQINNDANSLFLNIRGLLNHASLAMSVDLDSVVITYRW